MGMVTCIRDPLAIPLTLNKWQCKCHKVFTMVMVMDLTLYIRLPLALPPSLPTASVSATGTWGDVHLKESHPLTHTTLVLPVSSNSDSLILMCFNLFLVKAMLVAGMGLCSFSKLFFVYCVGACDICFICQRVFKMAVHCILY